MIGNLIAAAIGKRIDESDGKGGALGAVAGLVAWKVAKRVLPAAIAIGGGLAAYRYLKGKTAAPVTTG